jgi:hypothetical protein
MKLHRHEIVRAIAALSAALLLTVFVGQSIGYAINPAAAREQHKRIMEFVASNPVTTKEETDAFFDKLASEPEPAAPPRIVAVIQWHPALLAGFMFAILLAFRPSRAETATVAAFASAVTFAVAGGVPAIALAAGFVAYVLAISLFPGLRRATVAA